ncbi:hypothetical protein Plec18167_001521 [Paecilomyces lecythidis]|uniref:Spc7 kinetochore protein domain-containing protein n=1 Tax=Paecilomyces lecythidis TaxID=3004212 RepID=A0ABR3Y9A2_9EURO
MASRGEGPSRLRSRRSIAHVPSSRIASTLDKENTTTDISALKPQRSNVRQPVKDKKSRSKSLGPGGLDALQDSNGNRRKSVAVLPLKSILKPTVPVSPVRNIPSFEETRRRTPARSPERNNGNGGNRQGAEGLLIDFSTPTRGPGSGDGHAANPFEAFNASSAVRDDLAAAQEREEKERREREKKAILEQREARRKSMANRRVSFAPEATLHTWNVVELAEDSTSSSASNSTRRASAWTNSTNQVNEQPSDYSEPSSPESSAEAGPPSPGARSDDLSSSPFSGSSTAGSEDLPAQGVSEEDDALSDSENDFDGESTAMSMDDATVRSNMTTQSNGSSTTSSARLDAALRQAAKEAGTRGIDYDENGELSMEIADQEITGAFQPWIKKGQRISFDMEDLSALHDQENIPLGQPPDSHDTQPTASDSENNDDEDLSMDITNAVGQILAKHTGRRQSVRRKSSGQETNYDDQTMEFTNVVGGIAQPASPAKSAGAGSNLDEDEEMTMEFTSVVGGVLNKRPSSFQPRDENLYPRLDHHLEPDNREFSDPGQGEDDDGMEMEITGAVGGILPQTNRQSEPEDDYTAAMDLTTTTGRIYPTFEQSGQEKKMLMGTDFDAEPEQPGSSPFQERPSASPPKFVSHVAPVASESGSPSLASVRSRPTRASIGRRTSTMSASHSPQTTPVKKVTTPSKQLTPQPPLRPTTPSKTPPSANVTWRSASPKKLFQPDLQSPANKAESLRRKSLFERDTKTGETTPAFVLKPRERRSSGLGIDREGLGSPRVAEMLDKRRSIGEDAQQFVPNEQPVRGVRFDDPVRLQEEVDREREEEEYREDGHISLTQTGERDTTASLKDMISSLTPKKNKVAGRKSLHVGAARGLLGKRPAELDESDEEDNSPKRIRGRDASPVKNIRLPAPPTKDETLRSSTPKIGDFSPAKNSTTPKDNPRFKDVTGSLAPGRGPSDSEREIELDENDDGVVEPEFEPIQLQDFLNMTNIHFMELTTTKRRHTIAPGSDKDQSRNTGNTESGDGSTSLEDCVAAGFCTIPMLELYQHSCRELKSYISEGRQIIRSIEAETYAENPPLFREYVTAPPDIRLLMDNQFRNVKTHARLLSKAMWYEWRMKLLEGLKEGLDRHVQEMNADDVALQKQEKLLNSVVPGLVEKHTVLQSEATKLQELANEMDNCDQDELHSAREKLSSVEAELVEKRKRIQEMQAELQDKTDTIEAGAELKAEFMDQIRQAERTKEECRGWSVKEVNALKTSVHDLEARTGWSIISATPSPDSPAGPMLTMCYQNELQVLFHPGSFRVSRPPKGIQRTPSTKTPVDLLYRPNKRGLTGYASELSPTKALVLHAMRKHLMTIDQSSLTPKNLLGFIAKAWNLALGVEEEIRQLEFCGVTKLRLTKDETDSLLRARCTILGDNGSAAMPKKRRIDVDFNVRMRIADDDTVNPEDIGPLRLEIEALGSKVYGFGSGDRSGVSENQMKDILRKETQGNRSGLELGKGVWRKAVHELAGRVF